MSIFKRLPINIEKQLSVIGLFVATLCFKPLKHHVISWSKAMHFWHFIFAYQWPLDTFNDIINYDCCRADIPTVKEPSGLTRTDRKRPDGSTLIPWSASNCVLLDVTIVDTMAPSYAAISSVSAGLVATQSSACKVAKYSELAISDIFVPITVESFGPECAEALTFWTSHVCSHRRHARINLSFSTFIRCHSTF